MKVCYILFLVSGNEKEKVRFEDYKNYYDMLDAVRKKALSYDYISSEKEALDKTLLLINNWSKHELEFDDVDKIMRGFIALTRSKQENESIIGYGYPGEIFRHFLREDRYWHGIDDDSRKSWEKGGFDPSDEDHAKKAEIMFDSMEKEIPA